MMSEWEAMENKAKVNEEEEAGNKKKKEKVFMRRMFLRCCKAWSNRHHIQKGTVLNSNNNNNKNNKQVQDVHSPSMVTDSALLRNNWHGSAKWVKPDIETWFVSRVRMTRRGTSSDRGFVPPPLLLNPLKEESPLTHTTSAPITPFRPLLSLLPLLLREWPLLFPLFFFFFFCNSSSRTYLFYFNPLIGFSLLFVPLLQSLFDIIDDRMYASFFVCPVKSTTRRGGESSRR